MIQTTETEIEPDFWSMVRLMAEVEQAEIRDLPITGPVVPFPSPFDADGNLAG